MITMRKSIYGFPSLSIWVWGSTWPPFGPPELRYNISEKKILSTCAQISYVFKECNMTLHWLLTAI